MDVQPPRRDLSQPDRARRIKALLLSLASVAFLFNGAFLPFSGQLPGPGVRYPTLIAIALVIGSRVVPGGSWVALMLLWAAIGFSVAMGTIGIFSVGMLFFAAFGLLVFALVISPNRSGLASRGDWRFLIAFFAGYLGTFWLGFGRS